MPSASSSNYLQQKHMDFLLKNTTWTPPTSLWVSFMTTPPALDGTGGIEVSTAGTGYGRKQILASNGWNGPTGTNMEYSNAQLITFGTPTANWGTITACCLYDQEVNGNLIYVGVLSTSRVVNNGDGAPQILSGQYRILRAYC